MPRIIGEAGFEIYIHTNDHVPMHVHVFRGGWGGPEMIVNLQDLSVRDSYMSAQDARRALRLVEKHREFLLPEWVRIGPVP